MRILSLRPVRGFSLIELMITISIIAILAAIAYPSFNRYVQRSRRTDATSTMLQDAQLLQRCYSQNFSYLGCAIPVPFPYGVSASPQTFYSVNLNADTATHYSITATAVGTQLDDLPCRTFTLDSSGVQSAADSGAVPNTQPCWGTN